MLRGKLVIGVGAEGFLHDLLVSVRILLLQQSQQLEVLRAASLRFQTVAEPGPVLAARVDDVSVARGIDAVERLVRRVGFLKRIEILLRPVIEAPVQIALETETGASPEQQAGAEQINVKETVEPAAGGNAADIAPDLVSESGHLVILFAEFLVIGRQRHPDIHRALELRGLDRLDGAAAGEVPAQDADYAQVLLLALFHGFGRGDMDVRLVENVENGLVPPAVFSQEGGQGLRHGKRQIVALVGGKRNGGIRRAFDFVGEQVVVLRSEVAELHGAEAFLKEDRDNGFEVGEVKAVGIFGNQRFFRIERDKEMRLTGAAHSAGIFAQHVKIGGRVHFDAVEQRNVVQIEPVCDVQRFLGDRHAVDPHGQGEGIFPGVQRQLSRAGSCAGLWGKGEIQGTAAAARLHAEAVQGAQSFVDAEGSLAGAVVGLFVVLFRDDEHPVLLFLLRLVVSNAHVDHFKPFRVKFVRAFQREGKRTAFQREKQPKGLFAVLRHVELHAFGQLAQLLIREKPLFPCRAESFHNNTSLKIENRKENRWLKETVRTGNRPALFFRRMLSACSYSAILAFTSSIILERPSLS